MPTDDPDRHRKAALGDRAVPDFMAAAALADQGAASGAQQVAQCTVELWRHSGCNGLGFAQRSNLQEQRARIDVRVIVRQQVDRDDVVRSRQRRAESGVRSDSLGAVWTTTKLVRACCWPAGFSRSRTGTSCAVGV